MPRKPREPEQQPEPSGNGESMDVIRGMLGGMVNDLKLDLINEFTGAITTLTADTDAKIAALAQQIPTTAGIAAETKNLLIQEAEAARAAEPPPPPTPAPQVIVNNQGETEAAPVTSPSAGLFKLLETWIGQAVKGGASADPAQFNAKDLSVAHIRAIADQRPDEFAFVAEDVLPNPVMDFWPAESARIFDMGFRAGSRDGGKPSHVEEAKPVATPPDLQPSPEFLASTRLPRRPRRSSKSESDTKSRSDNRPTVRLSATLASAAE